MFTSRDFMIGVLVGVAGVWAYHRYVAPLPGRASVAGG